MAIEIKIPGYDSLEQVAVGGMAAVYKARQTSIDKIVAIKVLFPYLAADESFIERFQREAKSAAKVQHENIVNVVDYGESGGCYYIVMEFYQGMTIADLLKEQPRVPLDVAASVVLDVCFGLEAAHAQDIVHRDIKPANIIYTEQGGIKVADFGLAKKSDTMTVVTQPGKVLGTPAYMSPEQAAGESVSPQSDIFSLGVVAYELLCNKRPFEGNSYSEVLENIQTQETPSLVHENPLVQPQFESIIARMLEKDEEKRYASISDVIVDLERAMDEFDIKRDRRRLRRYIQDPDSYEQKFNDKMVSKCLSQGAFYMQKGESHLSDAMLAFKRILYLDPGNERALKNLARIREQVGDGDATVTVAATAAPKKKAATVSRKPAPKKNAAADKRSRPQPKKSRRSWVVAPLMVVLFAGLVYGGWWGWNYYQSGALSQAATVVSSPSRLTVTEGETVEFSLSVVAPDDANLRIYGEELPEGAELSEDGHFSWTVDFEQQGEHDLEFFVDDGTSVSTANTLIKVVDKKTDLAFRRPQNPRVQVGQSISVPLDATSALGRKVDFSLTKGPKGAKVRGNKVTWKPTEPGKYTVNVKGSDGVAEASQSFNVEVTPKQAKKPAAAMGRLDWVLPKLANIYVDGKLMVREDTYLSIDVPAGRHTVRAELLDGLTVFEETVNVAGNKTTTIEPPRVVFGKLSVYFLGGVGELHLNGKVFDEQPPFSGAVVPAGRYRVTCKMFKDEHTKEFDITVSEGRETIVEYMIGQDPNVTVE